MAIDDAVPPTPPADDKDWTWVLGAACPECGFQAGSVAGTEVAGLLRETAASWQVALAGVDVQHRPAPAVWSVLEYGTHCRDVYLIFGDRLRLLLEQDDPEFANWDQDATALEKRYWAGDPAVVAAELGAAAESTAQVFDTVAASSGRGAAGGATAPCSRSSRWAGTWCTTSFITCTTSAMGDRSTPTLTTLTRKLIGMTSCPTVRRRGPKVRLPSKRIAIL